MPQLLTPSKTLASVLIISAIAMVFLLPWMFSVLSDSKEPYYGLYVDKVAHDFSLQGTGNKTFNLNEFTGQYTYLMFGFTHCQEVCPLQLGNLLALKSLIGDKPVRFAFISLDPDRDTKEILKQYFESHGNNFVALRPGSFQASQALAMKYHEYAYITGNNLDKNDYVINHNGFIFLLNPEGVLKLIYTSTQLDHSQMLEDLIKLIESA